MSISPKVSQAIQFLNSLDPTKDSVAWKDNQLARVEKRSALHNFFSWFIYLITFTLVPRNLELDQITQEILKDLADEIDGATVQEKDLAEKAVRILNEVSANNGGSRGKELDQLLATMEKIQGLPDVQRLVESPKKGKKESPEPEVKKPPKKPVQQEFKKDEPKETPETKESKEAAKTEQSNDAKLDFDNTTLQLTLQDIVRVIEEKKKKGENVKPEEVLRDFWKQLPSQNDTVLLPKDELELLAEIFKTNPDFVSKNLSPKLLTCLAKNCLVNSDFRFLEWCVNCLTLDKKLSLAFVNGFEKNQKPVKGDVDSEKKEMASLRSLYRTIAAGFSAFRDNLTDDELRGFIINLIENIQGSNSETLEVFFCILDIIGPIPDLKKDHMVLKALCQVKRNDCRKFLYTSVDPADIGFVTEEILKTLAFQQDDPNDEIFVDFVDKVMDEFYYRGYDNYLDFLKCIFINASTKRQEIVLSKLTPYWIACCIEFVPAQLLQTLDYARLGDIAGEFLQQHIDSPNDKRLQAFAKAMTGDHLCMLADASEFTDLCTALLPLIDRQNQVQFVNKVLDAASSAPHECLEKTKLAPDVYAEASKINPKREFRLVRGDYSPENWAAIVNEQIGNDAFLREFFSFVFSEYLDFKEVKASSLEYLKPEVFKFEKAETVVEQEWCHFYRSLRQMKDQKKAQSLLISATLNLFNGSRIDAPCYRNEIYGMSREQLLSLPTEQYNAPEIRLIFAILTGKLKDDLIPAMNDFNEVQVNAFFKIFKEAYSAYSQSDPDIDEGGIKKDKKYLKEFLTWVLDRPSMGALKPTWIWINECYDYVELLTQDDELQRLIHKADLKVIEGAIKYGNDFFF